MIAAARRTDPILVTAAWLLILSGLVHALVLAVAGGPWEGSTTLRKPILFGLSGGATLWSVGWVWSKLPSWRVDRAAKWLLASSLVAEVGLITALIWAGQPSHFNRTTRLNAWLDDWLVALISLSVAVLALVAGRCYFRMDASPPIRLAIQAGMALLLISCGVGYAISHLGYAQIAAGRPPETYGAKGVLKFPHGACLHALQTLPLLGWLLGWVQTPLSLSRMRWWVAAHSGFLLYAAYQTGWGRARWEISPLGLVVLMLTVLCAAMALRPLSFRPILQSSFRTGG